MSTPDTQTCPMADHADGCVHPIHAADRDPEQPYFPDVEVDFDRVGSNPAGMIGAVMKALRRAQVSPDVICLFAKEARSGDYDNVIQTCMCWVDVS